MVFLNIIEILFGMFLAAFIFKLKFLGKPWKIKIKEEYSL
jgi:hypothetical protein